MDRKRLRAALLAALLLWSLTGCGGGKSLRGEVAELQTDADGVLTAFILEEPDGKRTGVRLTEETRTWPVGSGSWSSREAMRADFQEDLQLGCQVSVGYSGRREKLAAQDGEALPAYQAEDVSITGVLKRNVLTLRDGTAVDVMEDVSLLDRTYRLSDGTELLRVKPPLGPENSHVGGQEGFEALGEAAQEKVRAYYAAQGLLFDEGEELEKSYAAYREKGMDFHCDYISQDVTPVASNGRVMYFLTSVTLPAEYGARTVCDRQFGAAFHRETGEKIDTWDLFGVSEDEVRRGFPTISAGITDKALAAEMAKALDPDWIVFFPDHASVTFPPGSLFGQDYAHTVSIGYADAPEGFFRDWAVPVSGDEGADGDASDNQTEPSY